MTNHTPGPWMCKPGVHPAVWLIDSTKDGAITEVRPIRDAETNEANARLIAAAPEMLEALHHILNIEGQALNGEFPDCPNMVPWHFDMVRAAIAKAEGR